MQARSVAPSTDPVSNQQRFSTETAQASRQADPNTETGPLRESARGTVGGVETGPVERSTVSGNRFVPRGSILDLTV